MERMQLEILKLVFDYSINKKLIDKAFIEKLVDIVIRAKELNGYVNSVEILPCNPFNPYDDSTVAAYNVLIGKINIYLFGIEKELKENDKFMKLFNSFEQLFYKNLQITQIILHELEHANQDKIIASKINTLERSILVFSKALQSKESRMNALLQSMFGKISPQHLETLLKKNQEIYTQNYFLVPYERLAEIKSHQEIVGALSHIGQKTPNLLDFYQTGVYENMLSGYKCILNREEVYAPTITYFKELEYPFDGLKQFPWYTEDNFTALDLAKAEYSFEDRIMYGLPLDFNTEFYPCYEYLTKSRKYTVQ